MSCYTSCNVISLKWNDGNVVAYTTLLTAYLQACTKCMNLNLCAILNLYVNWGYLGHGLCLLLVLTFLVSILCMCLIHTSFVHLTYNDFTIVTPLNNCLDLHNVLVPSTVLVALSTGTGPCTTSHIVCLNNYLNMRNTMVSLIDGTISIMWQETCYCHVCAKN